MTAFTSPLPQAIVPAMKALSTYEEGTTAMPAPGEVTTYRLVTCSTSAPTPIGMRRRLVILAKGRNPSRTATLASPCT